MMIFISMRISLNLWTFKSSWKVCKGITKNRRCITFAEISRTILDCSSCSFILLLFLNQGIFFWYKVICQLEIVTENGYLNFYERFLSILEKLNRLSTWTDKPAKTKACQILIFTGLQYTYNKKTYCQCNRGIF